MGVKGRISALYRYPVKGLSPEKLDRVELTPGGTMPWDRAFAIENGTADFDPAHPKHFPKIKFLMLMRHERLAALNTRFEDASGTQVLHYVKLPCVPTGSNLEQTSWNQCRCRYRIYNVTFYRRTCFR